MNWVRRALCQYSDPDLFFPTGTTGAAERQIEKAKAVCRRCAVTDECLTFALGNGLDTGVFGGLTEEERRLAKRERVQPRERTA